MAVLCIGCFFCTEEENVMYCHSLRCFTSVLLQVLLVDAPNQYCVLAQQVVGGNASSNRIVHCLLLMGRLSNVVCESYSRQLHAPELRLASFPRCGRLCVDYVHTVIWLQGYPCTLGKGYRVRYLLSATMYYRTLNLLNRRTNQLTFSMSL